jgi:hypothetical protein
MGPDGFGVAGAQNHFWTNAPGYTAAAHAGSGGVVAQLP